MTRKDGGVTFSRRTLCALCGEKIWPESWSAPATLDGAPIHFLANCSTAAGQAAIVTTTSPGGKA